MTADAIHFHKDALRAGTVIASRTPSTAKGRKARRLALGAFVHFARAGSEWAASGRARLHHHRADAIANAQAGARDAHAGNVLLVAAGKLLRR